VSKHQEGFCEKEAEDDRFVSVSENDQFAEVDEESNWQSCDRSCLAYDVSCMKRFKHYRREVFFVMISWNQYLYSRRVKAKYLQLEAKITNYRNNSSQNMKVWYQDLQVDVYANAIHSNTRKEIVLVCMRFFAHTEFSRTLIMMNYISALFNTLNSILSAANLHRQNHKAKKVDISWFLSTFSELAVNLICQLTIEISWLSCVLS